MGGGEGGGGGGEEGGVGRVGAGGMGESRGVGGGGEEGVGEGGGGGVGVGGGGEGGGSTSVTGPIRVDVSTSNKTGEHMKIKQIEHVTAGDVVCSHGHAYRVLKNIFDANGNTGCQPRHVLICVGAKGTEPFAQKMDMGYLVGTSVTIAA